MVGNNESKNSNGWLVTQRTSWADVANYLLQTTLQEEPPWISCRGRSPEVALGMAVTAKLGHA
jgi:hypothetical protein